MFVFKTGHSTISQYLRNGMDFDFFNRFFIMFFLFKTGLDDLFLFLLFDGRGLFAWS